MVAPSLPTCFVVMPFGERPVYNLKINFNKIYTEFIAKAAARARLEPSRSDTAQGGLTFPQMMTSLQKSDVVVVDITYYNPNVYYELGIRHVLRRNGTVLIRRKPGYKWLSHLGVRRASYLQAIPKEMLPTPFDLKDVQILDYEFSKRSLSSEIDELSQRMTAARAAQMDSPVFLYLPSLRVSSQPKVAANSLGRDYKVKKADDKTIGFRSGDIADLRNADAVDFWVNSENTLMQMARMFEGSVSSTIRYHGALDANEHSPTYDDTIADALKRALGERHSVNHGEVLVTTSGKLAHTHGVKAILHAATVYGIAGQGFQPIADHQLCATVGTIIEKVRELIRTGTPPLAGDSVIIPLFGTGQARRDPAFIAGQLISSAIHYLSRDPNGKPGDPDLKRVLFSAFTEDDVAMMNSLFASFVALGELEPA
jgi:O-acetyl-ADP-ribose deacetylase (regulator of RNase III)